MNQFIVVYIYRSTNLKIFNLLSLQIYETVFVRQVTDNDEYIDYEQNSFK